MLDQEGLIDLYREWAESSVLSVYLDADQKDPAERERWRVVLNQGLNSVRQRLEDDESDELNDFDEAVDHLEGELARYRSSFLPGAGWVAFVSPEGVFHAGSLEAPTPDLIRWERGIRAAPYVRALKQARPVFVALLDNRKCRLYRYRAGSLELIERFESEALSTRSDVGTMKRPTNRTGIRGKTTTDAAQEAADHAAAAMNAEVADRLASLMRGSEVSLVIGGTPAQIKALEDRVGPFAGNRSTPVPGMHLDMTDAQVRAAVEESASVSARARAVRLLEEVSSAHHAGGSGALGRSPTEQALREKRVRVLLISDTLLRREPDYADRLVGTAFGSNGAGALTLTGEPGKTLDDTGEGVGALLHYST